MHVFDNGETHEDMQYYKKIMLLVISGIYWFRYSLGIPWEREVRARHHLLWYKDEKKQWSKDTCYIPPDMIRIHPQNIHVYHTSWYITCISSVSHRNIFLLQTWPRRGSDGRRREWLWGESRVLHPHQQIQHVWEGLHPLWQVRHSCVSNHMAHHKGT